MKLTVYRMCEIQMPAGEIQQLECFINKTIIQYFSYYSIKVLTYQWTSAFSVTVCFVPLSIIVCHIYSMSEMEAQLLSLCITQPLPQHEYFHPLWSAERQRYQSGRGTQSQFLSGGHRLSREWVWCFLVCFITESKGISHQNSSFKRHFQWLLDM